MGALGGISAEPGSVMPRDLAITAGDHLIVGIVNVAREVIVRMRIEVGRSTSNEAKLNGPQGEVHLPEDEDVVVGDWSGTTDAIEGLYRGELGLTAGHLLDTAGGVRVVDRGLVAVGVEATGGSHILLDDVTG